MINISQHQHLPQQQQQQQIQVSNALNDLQSTLQRLSALLLPIYDENTTGGEEDVVLFRSTEEAFNLWLKEQKMYMKWNTHKRADYRKKNVSTGFGNWVSKGDTDFVS